MTAAMKSLGIAAFVLGAVHAAAQTPDEGAAIPVSSSPLRLQQPRAVTSLDISDSGERILATGLDGAVRVWNLKTGESDAAFPVHDDDAYAARFLPRGGRIISGGADGRVVVSDARTGQPHRQWRFPTWCAALDLVSSERAAVGCADLRIRILDLGTDRVVREIQAPGNVQYQYVTSLSASPDGRLLASANPAALFDLSTGEQVETAGSFVQRLIFSPDGRHLLGGNMRAGAELWSVENLKVQDKLVTDVEQVVRTPAGRKTVRFNMPVYGVAWSPDGRYAATGGLDKIVRIWRLEEGEASVEAARLEGHVSAISALTWKGRYLASGALNGDIRVWVVGEY